MTHRAGALLAADHREVVLIAVQPGKEDDTGLVEAGGRGEDQPGQRDGRLENLPESGLVAGGKPRQRRRGGRRDRIEDAEQRIGIALLVAEDQFGEIEVVAGIHPHAGRQLAPHGDFPVGVEQGDLDAVDLVRVGLDRVERGRHRRGDIVGTPIAGKRRVEHVAEPVDDHRFAGLGQQAVIDPEIIVGRGRDPGEGAAGHQDDRRAGRLDRFELLLIGADHLVDRGRLGRIEVIGAGAGGKVAVAVGPGRVRRAADQVQRIRPVEAHAALGGVHGLGDVDAEAPQMAAIGDRGVPVDGGREPRIDIGARVGNDMSGAEGDAVEGRRGGRREGTRRAEAESLQAVASVRNPEIGHGGHAGNAGRSIHRRSRQLSSAESTSCRPLAPSRSV